MKAPSSFERDLQRSIHRLIETQMRHDITIAIVKQYLIWTRTSHTSEQGTGNTRHISLQKLLYMQGPGRKDASRKSKITSMELSWRTQDPRGEKLRLRAPSYDRKEKERVDEISCPALRPGHCPYE